MGHIAAQIFRPAKTPLAKQINAIVLYCWHHFNVAARDELGSVRKYHLDIRAPCSLVRPLRGHSRASWIGFESDSGSRFHTSSFWSTLLLWPFFVDGNQTRDMSPHLY